MKLSFINCDKSVGKMSTHLKFIIKCSGQIEITKVSIESLAVDSYPSVVWVGGNNLGQKSGFCNPLIRMHKRCTSPLPDSICWPRLLIPPSVHGIIEQAHWRHQISFCGNHWLGVQTDYYPYWLRSHDTGRIETALKLLLSSFTLPSVINHICWPVGSTVLKIFQM